MASRYVLETKYPGGEYGHRRTIRRARMLLQLGRFLTVGYKFRLRRRGSSFGPWRNHSETIRRVIKRTAFHDDGFKIFVQRLRDGKILSIHKVYFEPPVPDLGCHPAINEAHAALVRRYGADGIASGGRYYCRYVDGTRVVSRHGYRGEGWQGAAEDIFSRPDTMSDLGQRAYFLVDETRAGRLHLSRVIVGNSSWRPSTGWEYYPGDYHRHIHFEAEGGSPCL